MFVTIQLPFFHISLSWQQVTWHGKMNRNTIHRKVYQLLIQCISLASVISTMHCKCSSLTHRTVKLVWKQTLKSCYKTFTLKNLIYSLWKQQMYIKVLKQWQMQRKWQNNSFRVLRICPHAYFSILRGLVFRK